MLKLPLLPDSLGFSPQPPRLRAFLCIVFRKHWHCLRRWGGKYGYFVLVSFLSVHN